MVDPSHLSAPASLSATGLPRGSILFVTPVAPWGLFGGTATVSQNLSALFAEECGAQICCLRAADEGTFPRSEQGATILSGPVSPWTRRLRFFGDFRADSLASRQFDRAAVRRRLAAFIAAQNPAVIIFDHIFSAWLCDLAPRSARVIYIAHDDMAAYADSLLRLQPGWLQRLRFTGLRRQSRSLQEKILHRCDFTLAMTAEDAALLGRGARGPVEVAPLFFVFPNSVREYGSDFHSLLVTGSFDTWEKQRGLTQFLETVFAPLRHQRPALRLVVAGRIPADFRRRIPFCEPQVRVIDAPSAAEMQEVIRQASAAAVLDLQASGLKIKTLELAAAGLPLVSWAPGLEGTALIHDQSCLRAASAPEFIAHLDRLTTEPELRHRLGAAARAAVQAEFSKDTARARLRASSWFRALAGAAS